MLRDVCLAFPKIIVGFVIRLDKYVCGFSLAVDHEAAVYGRVYFVRHIAAFPCHFCELSLRIVNLCDISVSSKYESTKCDAS